MCARYCVRSHGNSVHGTEIPLTGLVATFLSENHSGLSCTLAKGRLHPPPSFTEPVAQVTLMDCARGCAVLGPDAILTVGEWLEGNLRKHFLSNIL